MSATAPAVEMCRMHNFPLPCFKCRDLKLGIEQKKHEEIWRKVFSENLVKAAIDAEFMLTCLNCSYFKNEICTLANQRPPAKIIVFGCEHHSSDEIPF